MNTTRRTTLATIGAAALLATTTGTAHAGPPWTVSVGGSSTGAPASYDLSTVGTSPQIVYTVPGLELFCESGTANGTITPGPTSGTAGSINSTTFVDCVGPLGIPWDVTQNAPWSIHIIGDQVGGVTPVEITDVDVSWSNSDGLCSWDVTGTLDGSFNQNNQQLTVDNTAGPERLFVSNVVGCFGLIREDDPFTLGASYQLANIGNVTISN